MGRSKADPKTAKLYDLVVRWNRRADADSTGAVAYRYWKDQIWTDKKILLADRAVSRCPSKSPTSCCSRRWQRGPRR